jgi:hypothetical protein
MVKTVITSVSLILALIVTPVFAGHHAVTMKYGGDWVDVVTVGHGNFMRLSGVFVGTNVMTMESGDTILTNFTCPGWWDVSTGGNGACTMKDPTTGDHWVLSWDCDAGGNCTGQAIGGTGRFDGVTGSMTWVNNNGWGEGGGTFMMK